MPSCQITFPRRNIDTCFHIPKMIVLLFLCSLLSVCASRDILRCAESLLTLQEADLGRKLIASTLQERSVADLRSRCFGEAVAAGQGNHIKAGLHADDICCSFAEYYTALADLLSRQPALRQVCDCFCCCAAFHLSDSGQQGENALHGSMSAFCSPRTIAVLTLHSSARQCKSSGVNVSRLLERRLHMRRHHILAVMSRRTPLPQLPWAQKSSWAVHGIMERAMGPC